LKTIGFGGKGFSISKVATSAVLGTTFLGLAGCHLDPNVRKQKYLESGVRYEKDGKLQEAAIQFSTALKVDRNFSEAHYELAKTYMKLGNSMAGYQELMRTVDLNPSNVAARIDLGSMLLAGGVPDRALDQVKAVLALNANNADAFALRSGIAEKKGDHAEALADIQHALAIDPNRASFHTTLALIEGAKPEGMPAAEQELRKAVSLDDKNVTAHMILATVLEKKGDRDGAVAQAQSAIAGNPKNLQARASLAGLYQRAGNQAMAEQTLRQAAADLSDKDDAPTLLKEYYQQTGQMDKAVTVFAELTAKDPKSVPLQVVYARILMQKQDFGKAKSIVDELSKTHSQSPQVEMLNAVLLLHDGKTGDALTLLQKGTRNAPDNVQLQLLLAQVAGIKGDMSTSEAGFREAARLDPSNIEAQTGLANIASHRGDSSLLAQVADNTIALHPDFANAYLWRGTAEANQQQFDQAEADFQTALKKNPNSGIAYTELGQLRLKQGKVAEGQALLEQALAKDANNIRALNMLVAYDLNAKQPAKGVARIQQQIARAPNSAPLYADLAGLQLTMKDYAGARDSAKKAMDLDPTNEDGVQAFSQAEASLGDTDQAISVWQKWVGGHPNDARATVLLGTLEEARGETAKAMEYYKKTLELSPGQPMASNNLAYLMVESGGNVDVALTMAQTARRGLPDSPSTADTLAWVYYYKGTYASARDLLEDAVKTDPNNASIQYHLGMTYTKLGDKASARTHLEKASSLSPNTQTAKDAAAALAKLG
jgi:tetratricopeptide (TPR) repeat protein